MMKFSPAAKFLERAIRCGLLAALVALFAVFIAMAADKSWLEKVPQADRERQNPYAGQANAIAAGARIFKDHCAKCHGPDALGHGKKPNLRSDFVQHLSDGEIFWVLRNGVLGKGMPSWSGIPEPSRWQVIAYLKSLGVAPGHDDDSHWQGDQP
jgi:mono/diheme cytochrome c family protein